jgi:hypothetical protein
MDEPGQQRGGAAPRARRLVRVLFWTGVCLLWAPVAAVVAIAVSAAIYAGRPSGVAVAARPGVPAASVAQALGQPSRRYCTSEALRWLDTLHLAGSCDASRVRTAWLYSNWFREDGMVFFDASDRVLCSKEGGMFFDVVSY